MLIQNEIRFVTIPLLTVKIGRSRNLAIIRVPFGLYNNLLSFTFTFLFSESIQKLFFKFHFNDLRHDSWNTKKQHVLLIWNNRRKKKASYNSRKILKISNYFDIFAIFSNCSYKFGSCYPDILSNCMRGYTLLQFVTYFLQFEF